MERSLPNQAFMLSYRGCGSGGLLDIMQPSALSSSPLNQERDTRASSLPERYPASTVHSTLVYCFSLLLTTIAKSMTTVTAERGSPFVTGNTNLAKRVHLLCARVCGLPYVSRNSSCANLKPPDLTRRPLGAIYRLHSKRASRYGGLV